MSSVVAKIVEVETENQDCGECVFECVHCEIWGCDCPDELDCGKDKIFKIEYVDFSGGEK